MKHYKWLLLLCVAVVSLTGCNNTDDVQKIFTGKTWKLSVIKFEGSNEECKDYWFNNRGEFDQKLFEASNQRLMQNGTFELTFTGVETNNEIKGLVNGQAYKIKINDAAWKANGESNVFSIAVKSQKDEDVLATAFLKGLSTATSYSGDENNLYIYFKDGQHTRYMAFHVKR